jgi:signal peptidase I
LRCKKNARALLNRADQRLLISDVAFVDLLQLLLARGTSARFRAKGHSMSPFIRDGDIIIVSPQEPSRLTRGDIVAFSHPTDGKLCVHRIITKKKGAMVIQGDNLPRADGLIPNRFILGQITRIEREGRSVIYGLGPEKMLIAWLWHYLPIQRAMLFAKNIINGTCNTRPS